MYSEQSRVSLAADQVSCDLDGETAILNLKNGVYYGLNPVGARVWSFLQEGPARLGDLRQRILDEYDVTADECSRDLHALLEDLRRCGLVNIDE